MGANQSEQLRPYHPGPRLGPVHAPWRPAYYGRHPGYYRPAPGFYRPPPVFYNGAGNTYNTTLVIQPQEDIETQLSRYASRQGTIRDKNGVIIGSFVLEISPGVLNIVTEIGGDTVNSTGSYVKEGSALRMVSFGPERVTAELQYDGMASARFNETAFRLWRGGMQPIFLSWQ